MKPGQYGLKQEMALARGAVRMRNAIAFLAIGCTEPRPIIGSVSRKIVRIFVISSKTPACAPTLQSALDQRRGVINDIHKRIIAVTKASKNMPANQHKWPDLLDPAVSRGVG